MELAQKVVIPVAPGTVWAALNDPAVLERCLPGCEQFETVDDNKYAFTMQAKVGPVKARFNGEVELTNVEPPRSYTLVGQGKGGVAGFAKGSADVSLEAQEGGDGQEHTALTYTVNASVGGKLAQLGSRLVDGAARKMANEFFNNFARVITDNDELEVETETIKLDD